MVIAVSESATCPYCGHEHHDMHELCEFHGDFECENCGEKFYLDVEPRIVVNTDVLTEEADNQ